MDTQPSAGLLALIASFSQNHGQAAATNLLSAIETSPLLLTQMNASVQAGGLKGFDVSTDASPTALAYYTNTTGIMSLPLGRLTATGPSSVGPLVWMVAHENKHAADLEAINATQASFESSVTALAQSGQTD